MTLEQLIKDMNGFWDNGYAWVQGAGGYYMSVAQGTPEKYTITKDGKQFFPAEVLDKPQNVVESAPKKRGRRAAPELDMDDLDI